MSGFEIKIHSFIHNNLFYKALIPQKCSKVKTKIQELFNNNQRKKKNHLDYKESLWIILHMTWGKLYILCTAVIQF